MFARFRSLASSLETCLPVAPRLCRASATRLESASGRTLPLRSYITLLAGAALVALTVSPSPVLAQAAPAKGAASPAKAAASPGPQGDAAKPPAAKKAKTSAKKKVAEPKEEPEIAVVDADEQQLLAAKEVHLGESGCDFDQKIKLDANTKHPGYVDVSFNNKKYIMKPVMSSTGALRLEDVRSEALMIQISSKTMLMNQKTGQRLVDNCVHADQKITAADAEQVLMK